jgi:hypothetical protein
MKEYKIVKNDYWDSGKLISTRYTVAERKQLLSFVYWRNVKTDLNDWDYGMYKSNVEFDTLEEADKFVLSLLEGKPTQGWVTTEIKTYKENA